MSSASTVAVATDADAKRLCPATSMLHTGHRVSTNGWPVANVFCSNGRSGHQRGRQAPVPGYFHAPHKAPCVSTNGWPAAITSNGAQCQHRCPRPMVRDQARNIGSNRMIEPELHHQSGRVSSAHWCVHLSPVGQLKIQHHRSSATRTQLRGLRSPESCETLLMPNVSLAQHRPWPNLTLKRNANSAPRRPSSAGPCGPFCARCPARHAAGVRLALR